MSRAHTEAEKINDDIDTVALSTLIDIAHGGMLAVYFDDGDTLSWLIKRGCVTREGSGLLRLTSLGRLVLDCADVLG